MNNIKLTISYDGTNYCGFQIQKDNRTVEYVLKESISQILKENVKIYCAGRTDTGVHAEGQVVNFYSPNPNIKEKNWILALNSILPDDIRVMNCEIVSPDFNARNDAILREYWYHIINAPVISALQKRYVTHFYKFNLDIDLLNRYASQFLGENDFTSFSSANDMSKSKKRYVHSFVVEKVDNMFIFKIQGNAFLQHMVRIIIGTMIDLHKRNSPSEKIKEIMQAKKRSMAGLTFPPNGLVFKKVYYNENEIKDFDKIPLFVRLKKFNEGEIEE
ncbi:MAG TPA: tRNA pseudouridine(38-40) synthase TruA [Spirochaetota bacterium]|nr:tRNA pseudouridine(38-40) synthase TruA [Spirochaetota bacterium]HOL57175.1 tRNA pseudouridine(38-40) synthase TruA [Spirochaetota bacterium]HPP04801.1 tRNA pseudouridine(38-40) synthase TruA [Spirochaetota bacterium]